MEVITNVPGESGDPASPHYSDLLEPWAAGRYHPLPYTRKAVEAATVERIQRYRDYLNQTQPGIEASASTAARMLLFRALEQVEVEMGIPKKASRSKGDLVHRKKT